MERLLESEKDIITEYYDDILDSLIHINSIFTPNEIKKANLSKRESVALIDPKVEEKHLKIKAESIKKLRSYERLNYISDIDMSSFIVNTGFDIKTVIKNKVFAKNSLHEGIIVLRNFAGIFIDENSNCDDIKNILTGFVFDKDRYNIDASKYGNRAYLNVGEESLFADINLDDAVDKATQFYQEIAHNNKKLAIKVNKYQLANGIYRLQEEVLPMDMDLCENVFNKLKKQINADDKMSMSMDLELRNRARDLVWDYTVKNKYTPLVKSSRTITNFDKYSSEFEDKYHFPLQYFNEIEDGKIKYEWRTDKKDLLLLDNRQMENGKVLTLTNQMRKNR